jgi:fructokinase
VAFLGALSTDVFGERLLRALAAEGVDTSLVARVDAPTTLGLVGADGRGAPTYVFHGERGADRQLARIALACQALALEALHVGSFATVVEPVAATLRELVERERRRALVADDVNVRLTVEPDRALAGRADVASVACGRAEAERRGSAGGRVRSRRRCVRDRGVASRRPPRRGDARPAPRAGRAARA